MNVIVYIVLFWSDCKPLHLFPGSFCCSEALAPLAGQALNPGTGGTGHVYSHLAHSGQLSQHQAVICCLILVDLEHCNFLCSALPFLPSIATQTQETAAVQTGYRTFSCKTLQNVVLKCKHKLDSSPWVEEKIEIEGRKPKAGIPSYQVRGGWDYLILLWRIKGRNSKLQQDTMTEPIWL